MKRAESTLIVIDKDGTRGTIDPAAQSVQEGEERVVVQLADGQQVLVPLAALQWQESSNSYLLPLSLTDGAFASQSATLEAGESRVIPIIEERVAVARRAVQTGGVRVRKVVREHEELVDEPLLQEQVDIQRVPINKLVEGPIAIRQEGDTMIISLVEEVLVVEKRLMLKEELHITRTQHEVHNPQRVTLRSEEAQVEHLAPTSKTTDGIDNAQTLPVRQVDLGEG